MKIAFVALPDTSDIPITPPLALAYAAACLEHQGHIARIYDLALCPDEPPADALRLLHQFRPHVVLIAGDNPALAQQVVADLEPLRCASYWLSGARHDLIPGAIVQLARARVNGILRGTTERTTGPLTPPEPLDTLPLPARHLLSLERYPLRNPSGALQTTVFLGQFDATHGRAAMRKPEAIVAELRATAREHGIRHFLFPAPLVTDDLDWLRDLLAYLLETDLGLNWEAMVDPMALTPALLRDMQRAGCESLCLVFDMVHMLDSAEDRATLRAIIARTREAGIRVHAELELAPPYNAMPALVDVAATFGLDDVAFRVPSSTPAHLEEHPADHVLKLAHTRYADRRQLEHLTARFGPHLGWAVWALGRTGLFGRRHAVNDVEDQGMQGAA